MLLAFSSKANIERGKEQRKSGPVTDNFRVNAEINQLRYLLLTLIDHFPSRVGASSAKPLGNSQSFYAKVEMKCIFEHSVFRTLVQC